MDSVSTTGDTTAQQAMEIAVFKKSLEFEQSMTAQLVNGSLSQGGGADDSALRSACLHAMGVGQNVDTVA